MAVFISLWGFARLIFIFLGWFLLSVQNSRPSSKLIPFIGFNWDKFKKGPVNKRTGSDALGLQAKIKWFEPIPVGL